MRDHRTWTIAAHKIILSLEFPCNCEEQRSRGRNKTKEGVGVAFFPCCACGRLRYVPQPSLRFRQRHRRGTCQSLLCCAPRLPPTSRHEKKHSHRPLWIVFNVFCSVLAFSVYQGLSEREGKTRNYYEKYRSMS